MKISVITFCYNEELYLPWFLRWYDFADEIHVFDNGSTDKSIGIILNNPKTILLKSPWDKINDLDTESESFKQINYKMLNVKNNYYKSLDADWYIIADADEFITCSWPNSGVRAYLEECLKAQIQIPQLMGYSMYAESFPVDDGVSQLPFISRRGLYSFPWCKCQVFHKSVDINYGYGGHHINPVGPCGHTSFKNYVISRRSDLRLLHYNNMGVNFWINRHKRLTTDPLEWDRVNKADDIRDRWVLEFQKTVDYMSDKHYFYRDPDGTIRTDCVDEKWGKYRC